MANCVVCSYTMIHVKDGNVINKDVKANEKVREVLEKQQAELEAGETPVGCYICPECGHCTWLET
jgi:DNA-directed RNA polymerase subunit M/transcription elongation factor TFIIS